MKSTTERKRTKGMDITNMAEGETESCHGDDISSMQIQALRSLFLLLVLAVSILVVVSSLAVLRKPKLAPNVNVYVGVAVGNDGDDSERLKRGVEIPLAHAPAGRGKQLHRVPMRKSPREKGKRRTSHGHSNNTTMAVNGNGRKITHGRVDIKHGPTGKPRHKQSGNNTHLGRRHDKHTADQADLAAPSRKPVHKYNSTHSRDMRRHGTNRG